MNLLPAEFGKTGKLLLCSFFGLAAESEWAEWAESGSIAPAENERDTPGLFSTL